MVRLRIDLREYWQSSSTEVERWGAGLFWSVFEEVCIYSKKESGKKRQNVQNCCNHENDISIEKVWRVSVTKDILFNSLSL